jgi:hypothetical protein
MLAAKLCDVNAFCHTEFQPCRETVRPKPEHNNEDKDKDSCG